MAGRKEVYADVTDALHEIRRTCHLLIGDPNTLYKKQGRIGLESARVVATEFDNIKAALKQETELSNTRGRHLSHWERAYAEVDARREKYEQVAYHVKSAQALFAELDNLNLAITEKRLDELHTLLLATLRNALEELVARDNEPQANIPNGEKP